MSFSEEIKFKNKDGPYLIIFNAYPIRSSSIIYALWNELGIVKF